MARRRGLDVELGRGLDELRIDRRERDGHRREGTERADAAHFRGASGSEPLAQIGDEMPLVGLERRCSDAE